MNNDPIDDYLQALIGEAVPAAPATGTLEAAEAIDAARSVQTADPAPAIDAVDAAGSIEAGETLDAAPVIDAVEAPEAGEAVEAVEADVAAKAVEPSAAGQVVAVIEADGAAEAAAVDPADALLAELDAAFDQARSAYEQAQAAPAAVDPADALLAELDAAFDQARSAYEQTQAAPAVVEPADALLAELDAAFDQARSAYEQTQAAPVAVDPADALMAELDAAFDQARSAYQQTQSAPAAANPADALMAELDAAFEQARGDYQKQSPVADIPAAGNRRIPPAPVGPPVLAARATVAQPVWQANPTLAGATHGEPRRRSSERVNRWLRLRCDLQPYALELLKVQEVVLPTALLSLRGTPGHMLGIMNLRGQVVPVMDLGLYLGREAAEETAATRIVVLESGGQTLGLRVSAVDDVASLAESQIEPPDTVRLCRFSNHLFRGMARLGGTPMILLDADALLN